MGIAIEGIMAREAAEVQIGTVEQTAADLGTARNHEQQLADRKPVEKAAAIRRIMATENPETGKPHSATSAEKVVETDDTYRGFLAQCRTATLETQLAWGRYEAAKLRAQLAVGFAVARAAA